MMNYNNPAKQAGLPKATPETANGTATTCVDMPNPSSTNKEQFPTCSASHEPNAQGVLKGLPGGETGQTEDWVATRAKVLREVAAHLKPGLNTDPLAQEALEAIGVTDVRFFLTSHPSEGKMEVICPPGDTLGDLFKIPLKGPEDNDFVLG